MHNDIDDKITHRMMYGFAVILSRYGTAERKTEMAATMVEYALAVLFEEAEPRIIPRINARRLKCI